MKKICQFCIICFIIMTMFSATYATEKNFKLNIVKESGEIKTLENNKGYISKKITKADQTAGEVTVETILSNKISDLETGKNPENTEVYIMVSENVANEDKILEQYITYIETLSKKIFEKNKKIKIGIIGIKGTISDSKEDENGNIIWGEKDEGDVPGSASNAEIVVKLTSDVNEIKTGLQNMNSSKTKFRMNLQAAVGLSLNQYSENTNKILISLFDGVPVIANGIESIIEYSGDENLESAIKERYQQIAVKNKNEILKLKEKNIEFILLRPDDTSYNRKLYSSDTGEFVTEFDGSQYVQELYGTLEKPTYGKMYSLNDENLEKITTEYIYEDVINNVQSDMKSVVIKEYFSKQILNNFEITFTDKNIDTSKLKENGYIEYKIEEIKTNDSATLQYKLKIKDINNDELIDKVISTSDKTEISYTDNTNKTITATSTSNPQIKLSKIAQNDQEQKDDKKPENSSQTDNTKEDKTIAKGKLPYTGKIIIIEIFSILCIVTIIIAIRYRKLRDI